ncbi:MAG: L,D-transpeptidase/peptidoglycan binding protein [Actinomycetota bacterium]|nr:L,D-transpeptidase/peptidoglycan binding protein [Actinomycetota bacterium]
MARKLYIAVVFGIVLLLAGAVGAYAWDASRSDEIAEGITIGGVDVGGMTEDQAERAVSKTLVKPLDEDVVVEQGGTEYVLSAEKLAVRADVASSVKSALDASQEGGLPTRIWRYATGEEVYKAIEPSLDYNQAAVTEFVEKIAAEVHQAPVNASVEPTSTSIDPVEEQVGYALRQEDLREKVTAAVKAPAGRSVKALVQEVEPEVTTEDLAAQYPVYITVDRSSFQLKLWENLELTKTYTVAIGAAGFETPAGGYAIQNKAVDPTWNVPDSAWAGKLAGTVVPGGAANNPLKARWLGFYDGAGIHGTDDTASLGSAASHGCVRMAVSDVIELYDQVPIGAPIYIG